MKLTEVTALMKGIAPVIRESRDSQDKRVDSIHAELVARIDGLIGRNDKQAQRLSALEKHVAALERRLPKG